MIPVRGHDGCEVGILGLGSTGTTTAKALLLGGATPICWDDNNEVREKARDRGLLVSDLNQDQILSKIKTLIVSPGIPHLYPAPHPIILKAMKLGVSLDNDIGLFFRSLVTPSWESFEKRPKVICVTGSNGKSTTTAMIGHILKENNIDVELGGNFGNPALSLSPGKSGDVKILEISSFQAELAKFLQPDISVFINLSLDHSERHAGKGGYFAAKSRLFTLSVPEKCIIGVDEDEGLFLTNMVKEKDFDPLIRFSTKGPVNGHGWKIFLKKGFLTEWREERQIASLDLRSLQNVSGRHNHQNLCAAYGSARALGLAPKKIYQAVLSFPGLKHRSQIVAKKDNVTFVNDSKATNFESAKSALGSFENVRWIAGGQIKKGDKISLSNFKDRVKFTYLIGSEAVEFSKFLPENSFVICESLDVAVKTAFEDSDSGDTVLLSPACASFDQFQNFEDRGNKFIEIVLNL